MTEDFASVPAPAPQPEPVAGPEPAPRPEPAAREPVRAPRPGRAWITYAILLANLLLYASAELGGDAWRAWIHGRLSQSRPEVWRGEHWRLLTALFVHPLAAHFALNMLLHVVLGRIIELFLGWWRFLALYLGSGLGGALVFQAVSTGEEGVGASGAIYGVMAAHLLLATSWRPPGAIVPGRRFWLWMLSIVAVDQVFARLIEASVPGIAVGVSAHFGGLVAGTFLGYLLVPGRAPERARVVRRKVAAGSALAVLAAAAGAYGCFFTLHDPLWRAVKEGKALEVAVRERVLDRALERWRALRVQDESIRRGIGYKVYEHLVSAGRPEDGARVLDEIARSAERELEAARKKGPVSPVLLNEVAWYLALLGRDLELALQCSRAALDAMRAERAVPLWRWLPGGQAGAREEAILLNTRGWVRFRRGEMKEALEDLAEACRLDSSGQYYAYLAFAHDRLGHDGEARAAAAKARAAGGLSPLEERMVEEVEG
ncbi:MAG: rhomboid family intramembrane serine protease [Planctomycetes bacterium]|nr:rhomboid family intramembrane serine protease [Planctomycetota bacterium]